jgi:2-polyprenyl-3-methyl-5-hydroxy-6-metoxy-1,4-benzoquinol methylase
MKLELLEQLSCPVSGKALRLEGGSAHDAEIEHGWLVTDDGAHRYPIRNHIPRFVPESNYADNFGMQWNHFRRTQLDSHSGHPISAERFWAATGWTPVQLRDQWVLDVGCGSGRFAEVALNAGAKVVAMDLSNAVDACYANLQHHRRLHVVQADIYNLPFARGSFPYVYSLGVLQHTPDVAGAFAALPPLVRPGGRLCVDYYGKSWKSALLPKYWLRPLTTRIPQPTLFAGLQKAVPVMLPMSRALGAIPGVGGVAKRVVPVISYHGMLPLSPKQHEEWALLDTFDMFAPKYDQPQTPETARAWMEGAGMKDIEVLIAGHLVARGRK